MSELKIGDCGDVESDQWKRYEIVGQIGERLVAEMHHVTGVSVLMYVQHAMAGGNRLLPPTPKVRTVRRWLRMSGSAVWNADATMGAVREADITYQPNDGRIVSITFVDEAAAEQKRLEPWDVVFREGDQGRTRDGWPYEIVATDSDTECDDVPQPIHARVTTPKGSHLSSFHAADGRFLPGNCEHPRDLMPPTKRGYEEAADPKPLDLRVGDVVRLRNGDEDRIERIESVGQPVIGMRHCWWKDGRYNLAGGEAPYDIVAVVKRVE